MNSDNILASLSGFAGSIPSAQQALYVFVGAMFLFVGACIAALVWFEDARRTRKDTLLH